MVTSLRTAEGVADVRGPCSHHVDGRRVVHQTRELHHAPRWHAAAVNGTRVVNGGVDLVPATTVLLESSTALVRAWFMVEYNPIAIARTRRVEKAKLMKSERGDGAFCGDTSLN
jgi:hypothetical protein